MTIHTGESIHRLAGMRDLPHGPSGLSDRDRLLPVHGDPRRGRRDGRIAGPILGQVVTRTDIQKRLERATSEMNAALANQKREIQVFRNTLAELGEALGNLERYMKDYREKLSRIDINPLRRKSLRLARIMSV